MDEQEQLFDVVDESDRVIRREKRKIVHSGGLKHRAVHILLVNRTGAVFLQRRSPNKDTFPNCWDSSCSGHVDAGETYDTAAIRELGEELGLTGLKPDFLEPLFKIEARPETGQEFIWVYRGRHDSPFKLNPAEITEGRFFSMQEIALLLKKSPDQCASALVYLWPLYTVFFRNRLACAVGIPLLIGVVCNILLDFVPVKDIANNSYPISLVIAVLIYFGLKMKRGSEKKQTT